jgi:hypothetical protein
MTAFHLPSDRLGFLRHPFRTPASERSTGTSQSFVLSARMTRSIRGQLRAFAQLRSEPFFSGHLDMQDVVTELVGHQPEEHHEASQDKPQSQQVHDSEKPVWAWLFSHVPDRRPRSSHGISVENSYMQTRPNDHSSEVKSTAIPTCKAPGGASFFAEISPHTRRSRAL